MRQNPDTAPAGALAAWRRHPWLAVRALKLLVASVSLGVLALCSANQYAAAGELAEPPHACAVLSAAPNTFDESETEGLEEDDEAAAADLRLQPVELI